MSDIIPLAASDGFSSDSSSVSSFSDSEESNNADEEFVFCKATRGVWGMAHVFEKKLYLTRDILPGDFKPKNFQPPAAATQDKKLKVIWNQRTGFTTVSMP